MMHFLFKPSMSYALVLSCVVTVRIFDNGYWLAAILWLVASSVIGGITETIVMERVK